MTTEKRRYYVHGDLHEEDPNKIYCAACDVFVDAEHFISTECNLRSADNVNHYDYYLQKLKSWQKQAKHNRNYYRPNNPSNYLA